VDGVEGVVAKLNARLQAAMPGKLAELRVRYGVVDGSLEDITRYLTHEPDDVGIDKPPMIVIMEQESDIMEGPARQAMDGAGGSVYRWRYTLGIFAWARGEDYDSTATARKRYGLAVREILLERPGLGDPDPGTCVLDPKWIRETYSSLARDGVSREVIAGTGLTVKYETQEALPSPLPSLGTVVTAPATFGVLH